MGSNNGDSDEKPLHKVCVDGFWIGKYEVTQGQWQKIMGRNPAKFQKGNNFPVDQISWNDCQLFVSKLNGKSHKVFRLPTEAEWEYACRSGGLDEKYSGGDGIDQAAWYNSNSGNSTHAVGNKKANGIGLYDMSGNVNEWCADWFDNKYYSVSPARNPQQLSNAGVSNKRVFRGGGFDDNPDKLRSSCRQGGAPRYREFYYNQSLGLRHCSLGFRL